MTQSREEWTIAAIAKRKPGIDIGPLRPAALQPYQEAYFRELLAEAHEVVTVMRGPGAKSDWMQSVDALGACYEAERQTQRDVMKTMVLLSVMHPKGPIVMGDGV